MTSAPPPFPRLRWAAMAWLAFWLTSYAATYPLDTFVNLCDVAVVMACVGLWLGSPLLLSAAALSSLVVGAVWSLDVGAVLLWGRHVVGGTEYMWDPRIPRHVRLLSCFHAWLPPLLWWALGRVGYDPRALPLQCGVAAAGVAAARLFDPARNINFAHRDPLWHRALGPGPVHVVVTAAALIGLAYLPSHLLLRRLRPRPGRTPSLAGPSS